MQKTSKQNKIELIQKTALNILRELGDHALTMRKVAAETGMSLSNVQYYFNNKNDLLIGLMDVFLADCGDKVEEFYKETYNLSPKKRLRLLINLSLDNCSTSGNCKLIREIAAIAMRNKEIESYLVRYYSIYAERLSRVIEPLTDDPLKVDKAVALLLPYIEGYSLTRPALKISTKNISKMISEQILEIVKSD